MSYFSTEKITSSIEKATPALKMAFHQLRQEIKNQEKPYLSLPYTDQDLASWWPRVEHYKKNYQDIVVLGTGGSSLGGKTLYALKQNHFTHQPPRLHFMDNVDPVYFGQLVNGLDWSKTGVIVISKSGTTVETLMQFLTCMPYLKKYHPHGLQDCVTVITEPKDSPLARLAQDHQCYRLDHDPALGGRFSAMSLVGLLPAAIAGIDPMAVRQGARAVLDSFEESSEAVQGALAMYGFYQMGYKLSVMMIYSDILTHFGRWYQQLWAESLGKEGKGMTPIGFIGTTDQHSQLQLYLDGPQDKVFTFISAVTQDLPAVTTNQPDLNYLNQKTMGELLKAELRATETTFQQKDFPCRSMVLPALDEKSLGGLMMHFMLETVLCANLLKINPFNQPAVEQGKILTRDYLQHRMAS